MRPRLHTACSLLLLLTACGNTGNPLPAPPTAPNPPFPGPQPGHAMVVSAHPAASAAGLEVIRRGGTAVDAAVTVNMCLTVTFAYAGNIGGGGFMVYRTAAGEASALDFREKAPAAATRDMYLDAQGQVIPKLSTDGALASGVPGTVDGLWQAHQKYGKLPWNTLFEEAIRLADDGFAISDAEALYLNKYREDFLHLNPGSCPFVKKALWKGGDTLRQPDLARTLSRLRDKGRDEFYMGETAQHLLAQMQATGGIITAADLQSYRAVWRSPLRGRYHGDEILTMPPPSSGGIALLQLLGMSESLPLRDWGRHSAQAVHYMAELEKRVFADRSQHGADPDFYPVPVDSLLAPAYLKSRLAGIRADSATPSAQVLPGVFGGTHSEETTHFSILDAAGNALSLTTTLNGPYGSRLWVPGAGFLLNNEMDDFAAAPGVPNLFGLTGGEANAIAPGKRMLSSMTPTIVVRDGKPLLIVGTPGGSTIITSVYQVITDVLDHGMDLQASVWDCRFHHQWLPDVIAYEEGAFTEEVKEKLRAMGHVLKPREPIGRVDAIRVRADGTLEGAADPRRDDAVAAY